MDKQKFCLVGYGSHSRKRIIPALSKLNCEIVGLVSKKKLSKINYKIYKTLELAIKNVPKNTIFIINSPPDKHFEQARKLLNHNFNIIIEKPIFIRLDQLKKIEKISNLKNKIYLEAMMYKRSKLYKKLLEIWKKNQRSIRKIDATFIIPEFPKKTFRSKKINYPVNLYDIGCYLIDLKNSLGLNLMFHEIKILNHKSKSKEIVKITFKRKDLEFKLSFGVGGNYRNHVTMYKNKKNYFRFRPFFFGRSGTRKFIEKNDKKTNTISFQENDSFINLYSETVSIHSKNRKSRFRLMSKNLTDLEFISKQYKNIINH